MESYVNLFDIPMITKIPKGAFFLFFITGDLHFDYDWCKACEKVRINFQISY